jgi:hypothetical protein
VETALSQLERSLNFELTTAQSTTKEQYSKLTGAIVARAKELRDSGEKELSKFNDQHRERLGQVRARGDELRDVMESERTIREETTEFLIKTFGDEILKIQDMFEEERSQRSRANADTMRLVE